LLISNPFILFLVLVILLLTVVYIRYLLYAKDRIEERFYILLKLHANNVSEFKFGFSLGRSVFVLFLQEFRSIHTIVKEVCGNSLTLVKKSEVVDLAYLCTYYGLRNDGKILREVLKDYNDDFINELISAISYDLEVTGLKYDYFNGHERELSHYFRHIYEIISFIDRQSSLSQKEKSAYVAILCAQLSADEQAFMFLHMNSRMVKPWFDNSLFVKYSTIKSLSKSFLCENTEMDIKARFPEIIFDWEYQGKMST
jgi:hypothetical protein